MSENTLYTTSQVAKILNVSDRTIRQMCYDNDIEHLRVRNQLRISEEALKSYIESNTKGANKNE